MHVLAHAWGLLGVLLFLDTFREEMKRIDLLSLPYVL